MPESSHGAVIDVPVGDGASRSLQRGCFDAKTVILARNLDPISASGMNGLICSAVTKLHFGRFGPQSETQQLVSQADTEGWDLPRHLFEGLDGLFHRGRC